MKKPSVAYRILKGIVNLVVSVLVKINITGLENFDKKKQYVIVCNHTSWMDLLILIAKLPRTFHPASLAERGGAYQHKFVQFLVREGDVNIVEIDRASPTSRMTGLRTILKMAKKGYPIIIFPEGRVNPDDSKLYPFYKGIFFISSHTGLPILPIYIRGAQRIYFRRKQNMHFGTPLEVKKGEDVEKIAEKTYKHLLKNVQPKEPVNKEKDKKHDLSQIAVGEPVAPPSNADAIFADSKETDEMFRALNAANDAAQAQKGE